MPKRKQPAQLVRRDAAGKLLPRRKRWFSHGLEKQAAKDQALHAEAQDVLRNAPQLAAAEAAFDWTTRDTLEDYQRDNGLYDRWVDDFVDRLEHTATSRRLLEVAPPGLQQQWHQQTRPAPTAADRSSLEARILSPWNAEQSLQSQMVAHVITSESFAAVHKICVDAGRPACARLILYYAPLWIRRPEDFSGASYQAFLQHLFTSYPVPVCLNEAWLPPYHPNMPDYKWMAWYIAFGQGASLYRMGQLAEGWVVHRKFQHYYAQLDNRMVLRTATMRAELERLEIDEAVQAWLTGHRAYFFDVSAQWTNQDALRVEHWRATASWLNRHVDVLNYDPVMAILDWSADCFARDHAFTWSGRTVAASLRHANEHGRRAHRRFLRWNSKGMDWPGPNGWSVVELCDTNALEAEGQALGHCVGGYGQYCVQGLSAVFSLRLHSKPTVTIELDGESLIVEQCRGQSNRACSEFEIYLIDLWLAEVRER